MPLNQTSSVRTRLIRSARTLVAQNGLREATARRVADAAQLSVSLINYHFTNRNGLICALYDEELTQHRSWLEDTAGSLEGTGIGPEHLADWLSAFVMRRALNSDTVALERLLWINAARVPELSSIADDWLEAVDAFSGAIATQFQLDPPARSLLGEFYLSCDLLVSSAMLDQAGLTLTNLTARRFASRLAGRGGEPDRDQGLFEALHAALTSGEARAGAAPSHSVGQRILNAALDIVGRDGADAVSHRTIAREAGVPLSATTRHFSSRTDILRCAFEYAHTALTQNARSGTGGEWPQTTDQLAEGSALALLTPQGDIVASFRILEELVITAQSDPALSDLARSLVATRGQTSLNVLRAVAGAPDQISRTDAFLWSLCNFGMLARLHRVPHALRADFIRRCTVDRLSLFR